MQNMMIRNTAFVKVDSAYKALARIVQGRGLGERPVPIDAAPEIHAQHFKASLSV